MAGPILRAFDSCEGWGFRLSTTGQPNELQPTNHLVQQLLQLSLNRTFVQLFFSFPSGTLGQEGITKRYFHKFRDDRFALTTLQNPFVAQPCPPRRAVLLALSEGEGSVQGAARFAAPPTTRHTGRSRDSGVALPFSFSLRAFMQILIAIQQIIKNGRK